MDTPGPPSDEGARLAALRGYDVLDTPPETVLDELTGLAAQICEVPICLISFVDETRQWSKSNIGFPGQQTPRDVSFCAHAIQAEGLFVVADAASDRRFADNPLVTGDPGIRFYAATPLRSPDGHALGTLCVIDRVPRALSEPQLRTLGVLGRQVVAQLELSRRTRRLAEGERRLRAIVDTEPECVKLVAADGSLLEMNPAGLSMIEADTFEQVANRSLYPLVDREDRAAFQALTARVFRGESGTLAFAVTGLKGGRRRLETHAVPLRDGSGVITALLGITRDVTARDQAESRLRESEERFAKAFYSSPTALLIVRLADNAIVDVNAAFEAMTGHRRAECAGRSTADIGMLTQQQREEYLAVLREHGSFRGLEVAFQTRAGDRRIALGSGELVTLRGQPHVIGTLMDVTERRRIEAALAQRTAQLHEALSLAGMGVWFLNPQADDLLTVEGRGPLSGVAVELRPQSARAILALVHPADRSAVVAQFRAAAGTGRFESEFRLRRRGGEVRWVAARGYCARHTGGLPEGMSGVDLDITERKEAELRVRKLNRVHAVASDIGEMMLHERAPDVMLEAACRSAVEKGEFRAAWIGLLVPSGERLEIRAHAGMDAGALALLQSLIETAPPAGCAFTDHAVQAGEYAVCNDIVGDRRAAPWRAAALARGYRSMAAFPMISQGRVRGTLNLYDDEADGFAGEEEARLLERLATDISFALELHDREQEQAQADAERRAAEERFRQVVENIEEVFWVTDPASQQILYVSPAYETIWQRTCESLLRAKPKTWLESVHPEDRTRVTEAARASRVVGGYDETYRIVRPDGSIRWVRDRAFPVRDAAGVVTRIVGTATDMTDQRHMEDQFRQAQKMESVGRLAGGIAHDFNNLLTVINGMSDLALGDLREEDPLRADIAQIRLAGDRAATLTQQLLALSRRQVLRPTVINLSHVIAGLQTMLERLLGEDVELVCRLADPVHHVKADPRQIEQVMLNLVINARDAMPNGGRLTIETRRVDDADGSAMSKLHVPVGPHVLVVVRDTGAGMDEATRHRVFEPFFTTKQRGKGTGLGLSTVYGIVQQSGGSLSVRSEPGQGTTFEIRFPRVDEPLERTRIARDAVTVGGDETILLVEDERPLRALCTRILTAAGYTVLEAGSGKEAIGVLERHPGPVHLLLTDVIMPGMNGRELATLLLGERPRLKVLYTSGYAEDAILRHGVLDDDTRFVGKPYTADELLRKTRDVLDS